MTGLMERIDDFRGNEQEYVTYLEREVARLRRQELVQADHGEVIQNEGPLQLSSARVRWRPDEELRCPDDLEARHGYRPAKRPKPSTPAWKRHADGLVRKTPLALEWWSSLRKQGIYDVMCNGMAVAFLLGDETSPPVARGAAVEQNLSNDGFALLQRIAKYAHDATQRHLTASVAVRLANFQQILVLSTCVVLRSMARPSFPDEKLLDIVKICLGDVSDEYCFRMLDTAVFINRLVDVLNAHGWDGRAAELLLWCQSEP